MTKIFDITSKIKERLEAEEKADREKNSLSFYKKRSDTWINVVSEYEAKMQFNRKEKKKELWYQVLLVIFGSGLGFVITKLADHFLK